METTSRRSTRPLCLQRENVVTRSYDVAIPHSGIQKHDLDCMGANNARCADLDEMIGSLEQHVDAVCRARGAAARARFDAAPGVGGFSLLGTQTSSYDAYVIMQPDATKSSGEGPTDNYTYIEPSLWGNGLNARRGVIAHEEDHESGIEDHDHHQGIAASTQATCS